MKEIDIIRDIAFNEHLNVYGLCPCTFKCYNDKYSIIYPYGVLDVYYMDGDRLNIVIHLN